MLDLNNEIEDHNFSCLPDPRDWDFGLQLTIVIQTVHLAD